MPVNKKTGNLLWEYYGFDKGEHTYIIPIKNGHLKRVAIMIRSSVDFTGYAAATGKDSIRLWLVNSETFKPLGKKVDAYTTRVSGWESRMVEKLRALYEQGLDMVNCPKCDTGVMVERKSKYGVFYGCSSYPDCNHKMKTLPQQAKTVTPPTNENDVADLLEEILTDEKPVVSTPSAYQKAIFDFVENGIGNAVVEAVAGSGKTTTAIEALRLTPNNANVAFVAFNKKIAEELKERAPQHVHVSTLHSLGFANIRNAYGKVKVDNRKVYWLIKDELEKAKGAYKEAVENNISSVIRLVSLLKATLLQPNNSDLDYLVSNYDVNVNGDAQHIYKMVKVVFEKSINQTWRIDFDDMIYFCVSKVACQKFDIIFVDEAQDLNKLQIAVVKNSLENNGRVIAIGDRKQSIYGFRGADTQAIPNIIKEFNAQVLPLSITYRCPKSHVALAKGLVPQIEAFENAIEGKIADISERQLTSTVKPTDMVLCRTNAPLVKPAFELIRKGIKAVILGRDIGEGLIGLIDKVAKSGKITSLSDLLIELDNYLYTEFSKLLQQNKESQAELLDDKVKTINALADGCKTIEEIKQRITNVFTDQAEGVIFSSTHRAKGSEAQRVFILHPELMPHPLCMKSSNPEALQQELNIRYVALTRSKNELYFVR